MFFKRLDLNTWKTHSSQREKSPIPILESNTEKDFVLESCKVLIIDWMAIEFFFIFPLRTIFFNLIELLIEQSDIRMYYNDKIQKLRELTY